MSECILFMILEKKIDPIAWQGASIKQSLYLFCFGVIGNDN